MTGFDRTTRQTDENPLTPAPRGVRLRTLIALRWIAVAGQLTTVLLVAVVLGFQVPLAPTLVVISASAFLNVFLLLTQPGHRVLTERAAAAQFAFDTIQLALLIALTGGLKNPFVILLSAPVVIAFTALNARHAVAVALLALAATGGMALWRQPLPWAPDLAFTPPRLYEFGLWTALATGAGFMSAFAWRLAADARRMSTALAATHTVLAREQRLSALGGLAAAAAHELGTPLGTILITAKEMARAAPPDSEVAEDAALLVSQAERCRDILRQLTSRGAEDDSVHARLSLRLMLEEIVQPLIGLGPEIDISFEAPDVAPRPETPTPKLRRSPEVMYAIGNYIENAIDYAASRITVVGRWTDAWVEVEVRDDGPGFPSDILNKLGEPYVTRRGPGAPHGGLGLGFFIAKTFVERTGGTVVFGNRRDSETGAVVSARWPRAAVEAADD